MTSTVMPTNPKLPNLCPHIAMPWTHPKEKKRTLLAAAIKTQLPVYQLISEWKPTKASIEHAQRILIGFPRPSQSTLD